MFIKSFPNSANRPDEEFSNLMRQHKIDHYKTLDIKTPLDLVKAIAESDHNVFGSDVEIHGDDKKATLKYNSCGMWNAMQNLHKFTSEQEEKMGAQCAANWTKIAEAFDMKYEAKHGKDTHEMTFSK